MLVEAYGDGALSERSCREWFQKFKNGEFDVEDKERSGSVEDADENAELEELLDEDSCKCKKNLHFRSNSTNNFISFKIIGNDSKARELDSILKPRTPIFHM